MCKHPRGDCQPTHQVNKLNNKIPFAFYPSTEIHEEIINFSLPPAAQKLYSWLARRARPGTIQEFDKVDFDDYCNLMGRKPFSIQWFVSCFKKLIDTRLVRVVRQYRGYGFKVQVYHPWQVDEWIVDSDRSSNKNCDYSNKTFSNSNENFKKSTSNPDSSVPLYRENKEKQSKERTGSTVPKPIIRKIAAASLSEKNIHEPNSKGDFSVDTPNSSSSTPKNEFKGLKEDLKADSTTEIESTDIKTNIPRVDVKVNKKDKRTEFFLVQLDELGVVENATIRQAIKNYSDKQLNEAIALYRQRKREGYISNPCGYFIQLFPIG